MKNKDTGKFRPSPDEIMERVVRIEAELEMQLLPSELRLLSNPQLMLILNRSKRALQELRNKRLITFVQDQPYGEVSYLMEDVKSYILQNRKPTINEKRKF